MHDMRVRVSYPDSKMPEITEEGFQDFIQSDDNFMLVEDDKIVGHGVICGDSINLAVASEASNKGYGTALAIYMTNEILRRGHKVAHSCYEAKNVNSRRVHQKIGYIEKEISYTSFKKLDKEIKI